MIRVQGNHNMFVVCSLVPVAARTLVQQYIRIQQVITHANLEPFLYLFTLINNVSDLSSLSLFHREAKRIKGKKKGNTYKARRRFFSTIG